MTIVEKADKKSFDYNTKYSEDGTLKSMLAEPHRFVEGAIEGIIDLLRKKAYRDGYIDSAKENGIQWHDLREDPNDVPQDCYDVLDEAGYKVFYHHKEGVWKNASGSKIVEVIAWCEIPKFEGVNF